MPRCDSGTKGVCVVLDGEEGRVLGTMDTSNAWLLLR